MVEGWWVILASAGAGFVDAIVGGGGLILIPSLFSAFPQAAPATLFGTNKASSVWGTAWAARQYARRVTMEWPVLVPAAVCAMLGAVLGASLVTWIPGVHLRRILPLLLVLLLIYTLLRKDLGRAHEPWSTVRARRWRGLWLGAGVGLYDGIFGPGTGSFFVFFLVRGLGYDFLHASAGAKLLNMATNLAALAWFIPTGHVWWMWALPMALANVLGSMAGALLATRRGATFVRGVFLWVVAALVVRTAWDAWHL